MRLEFRRYTDEPAHLIAAEVSIGFTLVTVSTDACLMLISLSKPPASALRQFVESESACELTYSEVGASVTGWPEGYDTNRMRVPLGNGDAIMTRARDALFAWKHFQTGWTDIFPPDVVVETGQTVAILARAFGLWSVHSCRIVEVIDEPRRGGFIYGTLPGHGESGEECFLVEHLADGSVWYDVSAFFRPRDWRVRLAWPVLHPVMNRFRQDSAQAMQREVADFGSVATA